MASPDQYDYLKLHSTRGNNYTIETEELIRRIEKLSKIVKTTILFATEDSMELLLEYSTGMESMSAI